jgi:hypothetical protein
MELTYNGNKVNNYSFTAKIITGGGELLIRAYKSIDESVKVQTWECFEKLTGVAFEKEFFTVEEFKEWYRNLDKKSTVSESEYMI